MQVMYSKDTNNVRVKMKYMFNKYLYITLCFALKNWLSNFMHAMCFWNNLHQVQYKLRYLISCALCVSGITFTR